LFVAIKGSNPVQSQLHTKQAVMQNSTVYNRTQRTSSNQA